MFLAVDIGNTHIVLGAYEGEELRQVWRLWSNPARTEDEMRVTMRQLLEESNFPTDSSWGCAISSVIPRLSHTLKSALSRLFEREPLVLTHELDLGIENRYRHPENVGPDRLANAVGGVVRYGAPLVVLDFGTATTFDVITADRAYVGGIIMPGLEMSADALFQKTSLLPRIAVEAPAKVIGRSTQESIASGLIWGSVAAVDRLADQVREEIGAPDCPVVATGGYAPTIGALSKAINRVDSDLTLYGLLQIWKRNRQ